MSDPPSTFRNLPSVDRVLHDPAVQALIESFGRPATTRAVRDVLAGLRRRLADRGAAAPGEITQKALADRVAGMLVERAEASLRPVFNLTGTVLHTNLGRAILPEEAIAAMAAIARGASNLEYDLAKGRRGDRDSHLEAALSRLTGAEAVTVVNNNAAAVLLVLNALALRREVPVSRGELIEIGGTFRMPDIMARAGCKLCEVGTTNRTHLEDYAEAIGPRTALLMKVHTSNYLIQGFTKAVAEAALARLAHEHDLPLVVDLGSGTLVDLAAYGLPHEPTPRETLAAGADVVTFSGDKLLGGPQAGVIAGRRDLIARIKRNPMKRAMRVDKMTIAALGAVLRLYDDPERLRERLPTLRQLSRPVNEIRGLAESLELALRRHLEGRASVETIPCQSQIGSGSLPVDRLESVGLAIRPRAGKRGAGAVLARLATAFRALPVPVVGRVQDGTLIFDLRCLGDEHEFAAQLDHLDLE